MDINCQRVGTFVGNFAVAMEVDGHQVRINKNALQALDTQQKIKEELERQIGRNINGLFVHINRDGSVAVALGQEPSVWPEDRPLP